VVLSLAITIVVITFACLFQLPNIWFKTIPSLVVFLYFEV